jgi:hypothetical protein
LNPRFAALLLLVAGPAFGQAVSPSGVGVTSMKLPPGNPYACDADAPPTLVTHEFTSGAATLSAVAALRLGADGKVQEVLLVHDPVPSLAPQEISSFQKWEFAAPVKGGAPTAAWATIRYDLKISFSKPQLTRVALGPVTSQEALPKPLSDRWDELWWASAPALADAKGVAPADTLDQPPLPRHTKWYAEHFKGPFSAKIWLEVSPSGRVSRLVPVALKDPALVPYLQNVVGRWILVPARKGTSPVSCWGILELEGTLSYDVSLSGAASVKKSVGPVAR